MPNVRIDIAIDVEKLLNVQPNGGEITDQTIVIMNQKGGHWKEGTQGTAKLVTIAEIGTKVNWKIKSSTTSDNIDLIDYTPEDDNLLKVFKAKPNKQKDDEFDGDIIDIMPDQNFSTKYTFSFCLKKNKSVKWTWDPQINVPFPPRE